jgi:hypothetical protein
LPHIHQSPRTQTQIDPVRKAPSATSGLDAAVDPQPHPACPAALASASKTQHASTWAGTGPPQHEAAVSSAPQCEMSDPLGCALHTPVAGSVSSMRRAPSASPVRAQAVERTCS